MSSQDNDNILYNPVVYHIGLLALFIGGDIALYHLTPVDSWWGLLILLGMAGIGTISKALKENRLRVNCIVPIAGMITSFICTTLLADQGNLCWMLYALGGLYQNIYILEVVNCRDEGTAVVGVLAVGLLFFSIKFTDHEFLYSLLAIAIVIAMSIATAAFAAADFVGEYGVKAIKVVKEIVRWVEQEFLTEDVVRDRVSTKCPAAFKAKIMAKKKNAVNLGLMDRTSSMIEQVEIDCPNGVSNDLNVNDEIVIRNY